MSFKTKPTPLGTVEARNVEDATGLKITIEPHKRDNWEKQLVHFWGKGDRGEWSMGMCKGCGCHVEQSDAPAVEVLGARFEMPATVCDECMVLVREHHSIERKEENVSATPKWEEKCPDRLKPIITSGLRPAMIDWTAFNRVVEWEPDAPKGMALMGDEGSGKTSAIWALFRKLELGGLNPILLGSLEMGRILGEAARDIKAVTWMYRCRVLMIDDLGKERASPGVSSLFWEVLNERYNRNLPVIVTSRFTGEEFVERFGEKHLGEDIRRRMNALCVGIPFKIQKGAVAA
jgi:hypothetical protein